LTVVSLLGVVVRSPNKLRLFQRQIISNQLLKSGERAISELPLMRNGMCSGFLPQAGANAG
jgi:hypothetical protein